MVQSALTNEFKTFFEQPKIVLLQVRKECYKLCYQLSSCLFRCIAISWIGISLKWFGNKPFLECWKGFKLVWTSSNIPKMCILGVYPSNPKYTFAISGARATLNMIFKVQMQILHRKYLTDSILWKILSVRLHVFIVMFAVFIL